MSSARILEFLLERIAEDEAVVRKMADEHSYAAEDEGWYGDEDAAAVAVGLARARRECEAKRRIVELHTREEPTDHECPGAHSTWSIDDGAPCPTLLELVSVYADHPDFDQAWREAGA